MISEIPSIGTYFNISNGRPDRRGLGEGTARNSGINTAVAVSVQTPETAYSGEDSPEVKKLKCRERDLIQNAVVHGTSLVYQTGPDGHIYIAGRKVSLDASEVPNDPEATIEKAREIRRAVTSQNNCSLEDLDLLIAASIMEERARTELMRKAEGIPGGEKSIVDKYV